MISKIKKQVFEKLKTKTVTNRIIWEVFSVETKGANGITVRIVDIQSSSRQIPCQQHRHDGFEEVIQVLKGRGKFWADGEWTNIDAGDTLLIHAGVPLETLNLTEKIYCSMCFFPVSTGVDNKVDINLKIILEDQNVSNWRKTRH